MAASSERQEAKRWVFTINNPTEDDTALLVGTEADGPQANYGHVEYICFQEERGENGTLHWQGMLILKSKKRLSWLKRNINPRAHWEVMHGTPKQARDYCRKEDTYTGGIRFEHGTFHEQEAPKRKEQMEMAADELETVKEGYKRARDMNAYALMCPGFMMAYKELTADILGPHRPDLKIVTMVGRPGTGKSYTIHYLFPKHGRCIYGNNGVWFQNPTEDVMVFEEFNGQIPLQRMLQLLDPYPNALEVKGGMRPAMYKTVIITSNSNPSEWYPQKTPTGTDVRREQAVLALWDRLGYSNGCYIPVRDYGTYLEPPDGMTIQETRTWFMRGVMHALDIPEPIDSDSDEPEHEELPDEPPSDSDDEQEQRRAIGYADH